jgi:hypothetical protein
MHGSSQRIVQNTGVTWRHAPHAARLLCIVLPTDVVGRGLNRDRATNLAPSQEHHKLLRPGRFLDLGEACIRLGPSEVELRATSVLRAGLVDTDFEETETMRRTRRVLPPSAIGAEAMRRATTIPS